MTKLTPITEVTVQVWRVDSVKGEKDFLSQEQAERYAAELDLELALEGFDEEGLTGESIVAFLLRCPEIWSRLTSIFNRLEGTL